MDPTACPTLDLASNRKLLLKNHLLAKRTSALFSELAKSEELQKAFIDSPSEVIGQEVLGRNYTPEQASAINKFLFSVLANDRLHQWMAERDAANAGKALTPEQRLEELAVGFVKFGEPSIVKGLVEIAASGAEISGLKNASLIVKAESVAVGTWFILKVSGRVFGDDEVVLPAAQVQKIAEQLFARAKQLEQDGLL